MNSSWNYEFIDDTVNASIYKTSNGGLVRLVMTGRIFSQMDERVVSGMVLLFGLRTVVRVTKADQGPTAATDRRIPKKADQGAEDDRRQQQPPK